MVNKLRKKSPHDTQEVPLELIKKVIEEQREKQDKFRRKTETNIRLELTSKKWFLDIGIWLTDNNKIEKIKSLLNKLYGESSFSDNFGKYIIDYAKDPYKLKRKENSLIETKEQAELLIEIEEKIDSHIIPLRKEMKKNKIEFEEDLWLIDGNIIIKDNIQLYFVKKEDLKKALVEVKLSKIENNIDNIMINLMPLLSEYSDKNYYELAFISKILLQEAGIKSKVKLYQEEKEAILSVELDDKYYSLVSFSEKDNLVDIKTEKLQNSEFRAYENYEVK